jgi:hypothetical protein
MRQFRPRYLHLAAYFLSAAGAVGATILADNLLSNRLSSDARSLLINLAAGVILLGVGVLLVKTQQELRRARLAALFGREAVFDKVVLVYPVFQLAQDVEDRIGDIHPEMRYDKPASTYGHSRTDVRETVAGNDIRALLYLVALFESHGARRVEWAADVQFVPHRAEQAFISFGLSSNECTHHYVAHARNHGVTPLVITEDNQKQEYITTPDGCKFGSEPGHYHHGVIVRYRPGETTEASTKGWDRYWFLLAGVGAPATPGAAYWLSRNWTTLLHLASKRKADNFMAITKTDAHAENNTSLVYFYPPASSESAGRWFKWITKLFPRRSDKQADEQDETALDNASSLSKI